MNNSIFWIAMGAYALHIMEEFFYDWQGWARNVLNLPVDWNGFYITNAVVLFFGIATASVGWSHPFFALIFPALMFINAVFFHIVPVIKTKKFSPGLFTAIILFLPISIRAFDSAIQLGVTKEDIGLSILLGILLMAYPIVLLKTKDKPFFKQ